MALYQGNKLISGGGVSPDWNQNDTEARDYVKNRTHYITDPVEVTIVEEQSVTIDDGGYRQLSAAACFTEGQTYIVNFNGTTYECVAWVSDDKYMLGNGDIYGGEGMGDLETPFALESYSDNSVYLNVATAGTYTISITTMESEIVKLPAKYLANSNIVNGEGEGSLKTVAATSASGNYSFAEGSSSRAEGESSHAEGNHSHAEGGESHAEGNRSHAEGESSHAEGRYSHAEGESSHAEGKHSHAEGSNSHAEGESSHAEGNHSHAEGGESHAEGICSHAEGSNSHAEGNHSHAEGRYSHAEGEYSHAEGCSSHAEGESSHAEGNGYYKFVYITGDANAITYTVNSVEDLILGASVRYMYANASYNTAKITAIDPVNLTITVNRTLSDVALSKETADVYLAGMALGDYSHSEGNQTIAAGKSQHTQGEFNIVDPEYDVNNNDTRGIYAHIVGNGTSISARSNAHTLDWNGNAWFAGDVYVGSTSGVNKDEGSKILATRPSMTRITLSASSWDATALTQSVTVAGISADETAQIIQCAPYGASMAAAVESGIYCSGQAADSLTFTCTSVPTEDVQFVVSWQDCVWIEPPVPLINFSISGVNYQAEEGMTWAEWAESGYNTDEFYVTSTNYIFSSSGKMVIYKNDGVNEDVYSYDEIVSDRTYSTLRVM